MPILAFSLKNDCAVLAVQSDTASSVDLVLYKTAFIEYIAYYKIHSFEIDNSYLGIWCTNV